MFHGNVSTFVNCLKNNENHICKQTKCCISNLPFSFILHYVLAYSIILKTGTPVEVKQLSDKLIFFSLFFQGNSSSDSL